MRRVVVTVYIMLVAICWATLPAAGQVVTYTFTTIDPPGSTFTVLHKINDAGQAVGRYIDLSGAERGFLFAENTYTSIDWPGARVTDARGLNNAGQIVGRYELPGGFHGFLLVGGAFSTFDNPNATWQTELSAINKAGHIAGVIDNSAGFLYAGGAFTPVVPPGADHAEAWGINDSDQVVGFFGNPDPKRHGFVFSAGSFITVDFPNADFTQALGINNLFQVVGNYQDVSGNQHGFLRDPLGTYSSIDFPGASATTLFAINNRGALAGYYIDPFGTLHGLLAVPSVSATIQPPINADDSSTFNSKRGVVPVKFTLTSNGSPACDLPPATIWVFRTSGSSPGQLNESDYISSADMGSNFRITDCQYVYNLGVSLLGPGTYQVAIVINGVVVGGAAFGLQ